MRTTLNIGDEILEVARSLAGERNVSVGAVLSELARRGLQHRAVTNRRKSGFPVFEVTRDSPPLTLNRVKQYENEY